MIRVITVEPIENYQLKVLLSNGKQGLFDVKPYLETGVFQELKKPAYFRRVKVEPHFGGVMWPNEQDFSPDTIEFKLRDI